MLILDNVDYRSILMADQIRILPHAKWLHVMATSQLGPAEAPDIDAKAWFAVDRPSDQDAFRLLEKLRRSGPFQVAAEEKMARTIVAALGGFTMAIEAAGIFLARFPEDGESLLEEIQTEGLTGFVSCTRMSRTVLLTRPIDRIRTLAEGRFKLITLPHNRGLPVLVAEATRG